MNAMPILSSPTLDLPASPEPGPGPAGDPSSGDFGRLMREQVRGEDPSPPAPRSQGPNSGRGGDGGRAEGEIQGETGEEIGEELGEDIGIGASGGGDQPSEWSLSGPLGEDGSEALPVEGSRGWPPRNRSRAARGPEGGPP